MTALSAPALEVALRDDEVGPRGRLKSAIGALLARGASPSDVAELVSESLRQADRTENLSLPLSVSVARAFAASTADRVSNASIRGRASTDAWLASRLHWSLRAVPRDAARAGLWASLLGFPEFAAYAFARWRTVRANADEDGSVDVGPLDTVQLSRLLGPDWNRQAMSRLWWMAELCRDGTNYDFVASVFEAQDIMNQGGRSLYARNRSFLRGWGEATLEFWKRTDLPDVPQFEVRRRIRWASAATQMALANVVMDERFPDELPASASAWRAWCQLAPRITPDDLDGDVVGPSFGRVDASTAADARRWTSSLFREYERATMQRL